MLVCVFFPKPEFLNTKDVGVVALRLECVLAELHEERQLTRCAAQHLRDSARTVTQMQQRSHTETQTQSDRHQATVVY